MSDPFAPSEQDRATLQAFLEKEARNPARQAHDDAPAIDPQSPEVYVAVPPCGEGIPARQQDIPGQQDCCIFKMVLQQGTDDGQTGFDYKLVPVLDTAGNPISQTVYNIYDGAVPAQLPPNEIYIPIKRDKFGRWLNDAWGGANSLDTTTTTTTTTPTVFSYNPKWCPGQCKWTWNGSVWTLASGCTTTTTTSTSTTTTTSNITTTTSTTTTSNCLCPGTTTTSTTSTTTTTTCNFCYYPPQCGTSVGQCYYTSCATQNTSKLVKISCTTSSTSSTTTSTTTTTCAGCTTTSTTTTTPCDCRTTSTPGFICCSTNAVLGGPNNNGGFNCIWQFINGVWQLVYKNCLVCPPPPNTSTTPCPPTECVEYVSYCGTCPANPCCCPCCPYTAGPGVTPCCPNGQVCIDCSSGGGGQGGGGGDPCGGINCCCTDQYGNLIPCPPGPPGSCAPC